MTSLICNACQAPIASDAERGAHYKSEWHRYNVKRRCAGLTSIPQSLFDSQLAALQSKKAAESAQKATQQCKLCMKSFATQSAFQAHLQTKKHLKKAEKQASGADDEEDEDEEDAEMSGDKDAAAAAAAPASASAKPAKPAAKPESKHDDEEDEDDEEAGEGEEEEGEPIPLLHCLFCAKEFANVAASCDHMLKQHGFFIPFVENLVDLDGLLTYLGEKIGIGHVCLWCNGKGRARYPSTAAVQQHMKAKSHCKLRLEDDEDEEELMDFYDFDLEEEEDEDEEDETMEQAKDGAAGSGSAAADKADKADKNAGALVVVSSAKDAAPAPRRGGGGASSINDAGELVLADGSIVGARQHQRIYKQHIRPARPEVDAIAQNYKRLALTTDVRENPRIYRRKREAFHLRARKREDLAKGLGANFQHHFRAQVSY